MEPLRIALAELDESDRSAATFDLHLSRPLTLFEREALPQLLAQSGFWLAEEVKGPSIVTITQINIRALEELKDKLKQLVSEAEALAATRQQDYETLQANIAAKIDDAKARALAIDWT